MSRGFTTFVKTKIMKPKIFEDRYGRKTFKIKFELEFHFPILNPNSFDDTPNTSLTTEELLKWVFGCSRKDLGELVLNAEDTAQVITE